MKIRKRFEKELDKQPALSTWMAFIRAVKKGDYKDEIIKKNFDKLVDRDDHVNSGLPEKKEYMCSL